MTTRDPGAIDLDHGYRPALSDALKRLREGRSGPARDEDRPPPSTFPMTPGARAALRYRAESLR